MHSRLWTLCLNKCLCLLMYSLIEGYKKTGRVQAQWACGSRSSGAIIRDGGMEDTYVGVNRTLQPGIANTRRSFFKQSNGD